MNVLHLSTVDHGGAANACLRLHQGLLEQSDVKSRVLVLDKSRSDLPEVYPLYTDRRRSLLRRAQHRLFNSRDRKIRHLPQGYEQFSFPFSAHRVEAHPLIEWADVINLHFVAQFVDYPRFFRRVRKPMVWTLHDMNPFSGGYHYLEGFPLAAYQKFIHRNEMVKIKALRGTDLTIVAPSRWLTGESQRSPVFGRFDHRTIPYGLNTERFKPLDRQFSRDLLGIPQNRPMILFVAASTRNKRKGFGLLSEAVQGLDRKDISLGVAGGHVADLTNDPRVIPLGNIRDERVMAMAYSAADVYAIASIEDNLPNTVLESICCGTPVVGFDVGGMPDMVRPGSNGDLSTQISAAALRQTLGSALQQPFDRAAIRRHAVSTYDQHVQAERYVELYRTKGNQSKSP